MSYRVSRDAAPLECRGRFLRGLLAACCALVAPLGAAAQEGAVTGRVRSAEGQILAGAGVRLQELADSSRVRLARTDRLGFFEVGEVAPGVYELTATKLGFEPRRIEVRVDEAVVQLELVLATRAVELGAITVEAARSRALERFAESAGITVQEIERKAMKSIPGVVETDPIRAIEVLPGVGTVSDFSAAFNVRGGSADQNLILLDNVPIYNPFHLGGLFSVFNADMVERAELRAGGFPAEYGGRVSSVLVVKTDPGDGEPSVDAGVSLLASRAAVDGSLPAALDGKLGLAHSRWRVSGRRSYFDLLVRPWTSFPYYLTDMQGVFEGWTPGGNRIRVTGYSGRDVLNTSDLGDNPLPLRWSWGNDAVGLSWAHPMRGGSSMDIATHFSRFSSDFEITETEARFRTHVREGGAAANFELRPTARLRWKSGVSAKDLGYDYGIEAGGTTFAESRGEGLELSAYSQIGWDLGRSWLIETGLRLDHLEPDPGEGATTVAPRFAVKRFFGDRTAAVRLAGGRYSQFLHSLRDEEFPLGVDIWVLTGELAPRIVSDQVQMAVEGFFGNNDWYASLEGYYRTYDGVITSNPADDPGDDLDDVLSGDGWSYGLDLMVRRDAGATTGWISASFLRTERTFPDLLSGVDPPPSITYPPVFDRRVDIDLVLRRSLIWWGLEAGLRANFGTGTPYTPVLGQFDMYRQRAVEGRVYYDNATAVALGDRNSARYPARHRLDISLRKRLERSWGSMVPYLSVVNLYNRKNVLFYFFDYGADPPTRTGVSMIPLLPTIGLEISF
ncbi:MAG: TonB-dependent receptor [Gemmatimonadetes bacterium]|nr:TonB-dependent receptor [Gemmatimonadota bacterium]